jgi:hypothetical protein
VVLLPSVFGEAWGTKAKQPHIFQNAILHVRRGDLHVLLHSLELCLVTLLIDDVASHLKCFGRREDLFPLAVARIRVFMFIGDYLWATGIGAVTDLSGPPAKSTDMHPPTYSGNPRILRAFKLPTILLQYSEPLDSSKILSSCFKLAVNVFMKTTSSSRADLDLGAFAKLGTAACPKTELKPRKGKNVGP